MIAFVIALYINGLFAGIIAAATRTKVPKDILCKRHFPIYGPVGVVG